MLAAQSRYGREPVCHWAGAGIALGRRLTPTVPEDRYDRGVEASPDGVLRMVADVRIDNRSELAAALAIGSADAARLSDSALLMAAWQRWRERALQRVVGDFALAVWDGEQLVLARDFPGQRPLCYWHTGDQMAFASMPRGLLALPDVAPMADERSLERFARHARPQDDATFFAGIRRVMPGETVVFTPAGARRTAHWSPPRSLLELPRDEDYVEAVRETLDVAVAARLRGAENGLACHLSAGLDSSAVAATAARLHTAAQPIAALTVVPRGGFRQAAANRLADEGQLAGATAALYDSLEHVVVERANRSPLDHFENWFALFQRPVPEVVNEDWYAAANAAVRNRGIAVLLHGQAGNLTFSYNGAGVFADLLRRGRWDLWWRAVRRAHGRVTPRMALSRSLAPFLPRWLWGAASAWRDRLIRMTDYSLVRSAAASCGRFGAKGLGEMDYMQQPVWDAVGARAGALAGVDMGSINKGLLAAWGIDARDPLADRRMIELTLRIPPGQFEHDGIARSLARRVLADRVPKALLAERRRGYQGADWLGYLTEHKAAIEAETARQCRSAAAGFLDYPRMEDLVRSWPTDGGDPDAVRLHRGALMTALSAGHFAGRVRGS